MAYSYSSPWRHVCGCYFLDPESNERRYLPQVRLDARTTILSTASRTVLKQTFVNTNKDKALEEIRYAFPLFDGASVVDFVCQIGDRTIYGLVKEKGEARKTYEEAKERGEKAALLEQLPDAADVFTTSVSNIPEKSSVQVTIKYIQELKHDAEVDGVRLTIPTSISPRYGDYPGQLMEASTVQSDGISLTIDVSIADGIPIKKVISPSHPIEVSLGSLSTSPADEDPSVSKASATLALGKAELEKDFVLQVVAKDVGIPQAILETHPTLPNQRALMTTLVPKFNLKSQKPEIIFIADRSGSMRGNIPTLISALKVFLKSIPIGCMFNICSFGNDYKFLWDKSQLYGEDTLAKAIKYVSKFGADFGGTETMKAVKACFEKRHKQMQTELMLLTDGDIWSQQSMFDYISDETKSGDVRMFPIGIGGGVSSSLIEGVARAGRGFSQMVANNEKLDSKIVRMLKGALTPHVKDYRLEVKYEDDTVDSVADSLHLMLSFGDDEEKKQAAAAPFDAKPFSLFDPDSKEEHPKADEQKDIFAGLPKLDRPKILQAPHEIPALFPFNRTCVYLLMGPQASDLRPKSVVLKGTSPQGPLELEIPVEIRKEPDEMIHQLAARKATQELEEGRGWVTDATTDAGELVKDKHPAQFALLQRREAVRLGVEFQVGGKYCSFVAVEANEAEITAKRKKALDVSINSISEESEEWEMLESEEQPMVDLLREAPQAFFAARSASKAAMAGGTSSPRKGKLYATPKIDFQEGAVVECCMASSNVQLDTGIQSARMKRRSVQLPGSGLFSSLRKAFTPKKGKKANASPSQAGSYPPVPAVKRKAISSAHMSTGGMAPQMQFASVALCAAPAAAEAADEESDADEDMGSGLFDDDVEEEAERLKAATLAEYTKTKAGLPKKKLPGSVRTGGSKKEATESGTLLERLIARQSFDGSWTGIGDLLCDEMKINRNDAKSAVQSIVSSSKEAMDRAKAEMVMNTVIVVTFLEKNMAAEEDTWELIVEKARAWLEDAVAADIQAEAWKLADGIVRA